MISFSLHKPLEKEGGELGGGGKGGSIKKSKDISKKYISGKNFRFENIVIEDGSVQQD